MVVVVLVLVWGIALTPIVLRKRSEWRLSTSVAGFGSALRSFHKVQNQQSAGAALASDGTDGAPRPNPGRRSAPSAARDGVTARQARRRRVLELLVGSVLISAVLGAIPALRMMWVLTIVCAVLTLGYVGLLVRFTRRAADRSELARKVVPLRARPAPEVASDERLVAVGGAPGASAAPASSLPPARPAFVIIETP